jgi:hypothetical protein
MAVGAVVARILTQYSDKGSKAAQKDIAKLQKRIDAFGKKALKSFAVAGAAATAFAIKIGVDAVKGAAADEKAQTSLAIAIRNSTSATEEAIAANTKFLDQLELQVAVDNDELIPALQKLTIATGDLSQAQNLLILSTDVAVASGKDLGAVTTAISRAMGGNFTALTRLGLPIDKVALKQGNLNKILDDFAKLSKGQASAAANTYSGRLKVLALSYNQVIDKLGYALMPLILDFVDYLVKPGGLLDSLDEWIEKNETDLQESLKGVSDLFKLIIDNGDNLTKILGVLVAISGALNTTILGTIKLGEIAVVFGVFAYLTRQVSKVLKTLRIDAKEVAKVTDDAAKKAKGTSDAVKKVGDGFGTKKTTKSLGIVRTALNAVSTRAKIALALVAAVGSGTLFSKIGDFLAGGNDAELLKQMQAQAKIDFQQEQAAKEQARLDKIVYDNSIKYQADLDRQREIDALKRAQEVKKQEALEAKILKRQTAIRKSLGIKGSNQIDAEKDLVQLNAAEALLKRQQKNNEIDKERLKNLREEVLLQKVRNDLAARYDDILKALADGKVDSKDIAILAGKWGVTTEAANAYIKTIFAVEDGTVSDDEIIELAKSWGSTQAQAAQYLDFFVALNDGVLSDAEIEKLKAKWKLTEDQVRMYADFVGVVNDGKLTDNEIEKLKAKWILTTDQVVDYIKKIGSPVSYSGTLIDPARAAEIGWLNATAALQRYLDLLKAGTGAVITTVTAPAPNTDGNSAAAIAAAAIAAVQAGDAADEAAKILAESEAALADAMKEASDAAAASAQFTEELTNLFPELMKSVAVLEASQAAKEASGRSYTTDAELDRILGGSRSDSAASYDERFRFKAFSPTMNTASGGGFQNSMAGNTNITVNVAGSVTAEDDLVQAIRQGLLYGQGNGDTLTLQAI